MTTNLIDNNNNKGIICVSKWNGRRVILRRNSKLSNNRKKEANRKNEVKFKCGNKNGDTNNTKNTKNTNNTTNTTNNGKKIQVAHCWPFINPETGEIVTVVKLWKSPDIPGRLSPFSSLFSHDYNSNELLSLSFFYFLLYWWFPIVFLLFLFRFCFILLSFVGNCNPTTTVSVRCITVKN